jgi:hypothetical protein
MNDAPRTAGRSMNADGQPPSAVARFVSLHLDSVAELEALLLVHATPGERWDVRRVARRLYISDADARLVLHSLHRRGLVSHDGTRFQYQPQHEDLRRDVDALAAAYPQFLIPLTELIHTKSRSAGSARSRNFDGPIT